MYFCQNYCSYKCRSISGLCTSSYWACKFLGLFLFPSFFFFFYCWVEVVYVFWIISLYQIDDLHISLILCAVLLPSPCLLEALSILSSGNIWRTWHFVTNKETLWIKYRISLNFFFNFIQNLTIVLIAVFLLQCFSSPLGNWRSLKIFKLERGRCMFSEHILQLCIWPNEI